MINIEKLKDLLWLLNDNYEAEKQARQLYQEQEINEAKRILNNEQ